jgi:hypothetical protein
MINLENLVVFHCNAINYISTSSENYTTNITQKVPLSPFGKNQQKSDTKGI